MDDRFPSTALYLAGAALVVLLGGRVLYGMVKISGPRRVALLGDSLTGGPGYASTLESSLSNRSVVKVYSYPVKGTAFIRNRVFEALSWNPTDLVVLAGVNDLASGRGPGVVIDNLADIYAEARARGVRVVAVTLTPWAGHFQGGLRAVETSEVNQWIQYESRADVAIRTQDLGDNFGALKSWYDSGDGLHLNSAGQAALGHLVAGAF